MDCEDRSWDMRKEEEGSKIDQSPRQSLLWFGEIKAAWYECPLILNDLV